jgi:hypothetical protein
LRNAAAAADEMGKLNIAHHKSYHPYRADNIARVKKDEEKARLLEEQEERRTLQAVSAASCVLYHALVLINDLLRGVA